MSENQWPKTLFCNGIKYQGKTQPHNGCRILCASRRKQKYGKEKFDLLRIFYLTKTNTFLKTLDSIKELCYF